MVRNSKRARRFLLVAVLVVASSAMVSASAVAQLVARGSDAGELYQFSSKVANVSLDNTGSEPLTVDKVEIGVSSDQVISTMPITIAPKSSSEVSVNVNIGPEVGSRYHSFRFYSSENSQYTAVARIHLFGLSVLDDPLPIFDLGVVETSGKKYPQSSVLLRDEAGGLQVERVLEAPDFIVTSIRPDRGGVFVQPSLDSKILWGRHSGYIKLAINSKAQREAWIRVDGDFRGNIVPSQNPLNLGLVRKGEANYSLLQLKDISGRKIKLGEISVAGTSLEISREECIPASPSCVQLKVGVASKEPTGRVFAVIEANLPDYGRKLSIDALGVLLGADSRILPLKGSESQTSSNGSTDIARALKMVSSELPSSPPSGHGPLLKWNAENESFVYGYLVFRSDEKEGNYTRINADIVRAADSSSYAWRDTSAIAGRTYWYYIVAIMDDGHKERLTPPQEIVAK